jgi:hypothetical protein
MTTLVNDPATAEAEPGAALQPDGAAETADAGPPSVDMRNVCAPQPVLDALGRLAIPGLVTVALAMFAAVVFDAPPWTRTALTASLLGWAVFGFAWAVWPRPPYRLFPRMPRQRVPVDD